MRVVVALNLQCASISLNKRTHTRPHSLTLPITHARVRSKHLYLSISFSLAPSARPSKHGQRTTEMATAAKQMAATTMPKQKTRAGRARSKPKMFDRAPHLGSSTSCSSTCATRVHIVGCKRHTHTYEHAHSFVQNPDLGINLL